MTNCPHCKAAIDCESAWRNTDHQSYFRSVCGECDGIVVISVESVPKFSVSVPKCERCSVVIDGTKWYCESCQRDLEVDDKRRAKLERRA